MAKIYFFFYLLLITAGTTHAQETAYVNVSTGQVTEEAKSAMIKGKITTTDQKPAEMVNVSIKETGRSTMTNVNGHFILRNIKEGTYTLQVSMIGLQNQEKVISVKTGEALQIDFTLPQNQEQLSEIIVTSSKGLNKNPVSIGKISIDPMDLPQSLSIIGQGLIKDQQAQRLSDVIKNVNGVYLGTSRGNVQESFYALVIVFPIAICLKMEPGSIPVLCLK